MYNFVLLFQKMYAFWLKFGNKDTKLYFFLIGDVILKEIEICTFVLNFGLRGINSETKVWNCGENYTF